MEKIYLSYSISSVPIWYTQVVFISTKVHLNSLRFIIKNCLNSQDLDLLKQNPTLQKNKEKSNSLIFNGIIKICNKKSMLLHTLLNCIVDTQPNLQSKGCWFCRGVHRWAHEWRVIRHHFQSSSDEGNPACKLSINFV